MVDNNTLGLIAGNGIFPQLFAKAAKEQGIEVIAVAMRGETDPAIEAFVDSLTWVRVGQLGKMIRCFKRAGVTQAAMAGGIRKTRLFESIKERGRRSLYPQPQKMLDMLAQGKMESTDENDSKWKCIIFDKHGGLAMHAIYIFICAVILIWKDLP